MKSLKKFFINFILIIWQLPQNILGLLVLLAFKFLDKKMYIKIIKNKFLYLVCMISKYNSVGVSLGCLTIISKKYYYMNDDYMSNLTLRHEYGHYMQSIILGPLYLILIGLPSLIYNIYDRIFHKKMNIAKRLKLYYNMPWENWADKLGNVNRMYSNL